MPRPGLILANVFQTGHAMKAAVAGACLLAGCASRGDAPPAPDPRDSARVDHEVITSVRDAAVANAIVTQHTLYPYHFVPNGADLNELGERDLAALAGFYRSNPGELSIRRGDSPDAIYEARVHAVQQQLARAGVEVARVRIEDHLPAGTGLASEDVIHILQLNWKDTGKMYSEGGGGEISGAGGMPSSSNGSSGAGASSSGGGLR